MKNQPMSELNELMDIYDTALKINQNEFDTLESLVKNKPIYQKLLFAKGGIQSSIQHYKNFIAELFTINQEMLNKLSLLVYHSKQVKERVENISQYQNHQADYQKFYKNFSQDVNVCEVALQKFLSEYNTTQVLITPFTVSSEEKAIEQVVKFNHELNHQIYHLVQEFEKFKQTYVQLLQHEKPLHHLMHLCDVQQTE